MLREFKEFITRGNVLGLAVAVVMGAAFGVVVSSFVKDILMQLVAALGAAPSFASLSFTLNGAEIRYGAFLNAVVMFLIVSAAMFLVVKGYNRIVRRGGEARRRERGRAAEADPRRARSPARRDLSGALPGLPPGAGRRSRVRR